MKKKARLYLLMKSNFIELKVAKYFNPVINLIVPNVYWGMFNYEMDLLIITKSGYGYEVEIKVNKQDLKNDLKKYHQHDSYKIKYLYFAIPEKLLKHENLIPEKAGILIIKQNRNEKYYCSLYRKPSLLNNYKFLNDEKLQIARLGTMRIWNLKKKILEYENSNN